ncbi:MAG: 3'-5' exonuclease [Thermodesulfobacteriota bacterium]
MSLLSRLGLGRPQHPVFARNASYFAGLDHQRPIEEYEFVVFDTELTGLNPRRDEIVSIGAVRIRGLRILLDDTFRAYVKPFHPLPKDSTLIHRITPQQLEAAPPLREVLPAFIDYCGNSLLVAHHIGLDVAFLNKAAKTLYGSPIHNPCLDTMRLAQAYTEMRWEQYHDRFRMNVSYNLAALSAEYALPPFTHHDAFEDALQAAYLFLYLVKKMRSEGVVTLKDLFNAGQTWRWIM